MLRLCRSLLHFPLLASRLIALDKNPGIRPIGIGETPRRIIAKAVLSVTRDDIQNAAGSVQLCAGQIAGVEAAVHAVQKSFQQDETEAALLIDASNAFNSLNRDAALHNIRFLCPSISTMLINTYRAPTELYIDGEVIFSREGTTQGDPLAMPMYAIATIPLIRSLPESVSQVWYADDAAALGTVAELRNWWDNLTKLGLDSVTLQIPSRRGWSLRTPASPEPPLPLLTPMSTSPALDDHTWGPPWAPLSTRPNLCVIRWRYGQTS